MSLLLQLLYDANVVDVDKDDWSKTNASKPNTTNNQAKQLLVIVYWYRGIDI